MIIVTSRNSLPNCEHDPSYQYRSQSNLVKAFFVLHVEVLTSFEHNFKKQLPKVFYKKVILKNFAIFIEKHLRWSLFFNKSAGLEAGNFITKRLQHRYFFLKTANVLKYLFSSTSVNDCFWSLSIQKGSNNRKNREVFRDVFRDDNRRHIQNPVKHVRLVLQSLQIYFWIQFYFHIITFPWDMNHKFKTCVIHFKLIHPCSWIYKILINHYLFVQTNHNF